MSSNYWAKVYVEILDDPKIGMLPDPIKWKFIEFLLVAKETDRGGLLPPVAALAWRLRVPPDVIMAALTELEGQGIAAQTEDGWILVNFAKRQGPSPVAERVAEYRKRNANVTKGYTGRNDVKSPETDTDTELIKREGAGGDTQPPPEPPDDFEMMRNEVLRVVGPFQADTDNILAINELVRIGARTEDLEAAVVYFRDELKKPIRGPAHMLESVKYNIKKRTQAGITARSNGRNGSGKPKKQERFVEEYGL